MHTGCGHSYTIIKYKHNIMKATDVSRESALQPRARQRNNRVPLVTTYDSRLPNLNKITRNYLPVLHVSERLKEAIPEAPMTAYRRPKNLRDLLVRAELKFITEDTRRNGNSPCNVRLANMSGPRIDSGARSQASSTEYTHPLPARQRT